MCGLGALGIPVLIIVFFLLLAVAGANFWYFVCRPGGRFLKRLGSERRALGRAGSGKGPRPQA